MRHMNQDFRGKTGSRNCHFPVKKALFVLVLAIFHGWIVLFSNKALYEI